MIVLCFPLCNIEWICITQQSPPGLSLLGGIQPHHYDILNNLPWKVLIVVTEVVLLLWLWGLRDPRQFAPAKQII